MGKDGGRAAGPGSKGELKAKRDAGLWVCVDRSSEAAGPRRRLRPAQVEGQHTD